MSPEDYVTWQSKKLDARYRLNARLKIMTGARMWRMEGVFNTAVLRLQYEDFGKAAGELLARFKREPDGDISAEMMELLNAARNTCIKARPIAAIVSKFNDMAEDVDDEWKLEQCENCGAYGACLEYVSNTNERICEDCAENSNSYVWSEVMQERLSFHAHQARDRTVPVFDTAMAAHRDNVDDWVTRQYAQDNYHNIDHSSYSYAYISDSDEYYEYEDANRDEDEDDEYDRSPSRHDSDYLAEYHCDSRRHDSDYFKEENATPAVPALGIEIEVYVKGNRGEALTALRSDGNSTISEMVYERDGSLHSGKSFEVVTPPLGQQEWSTFGPELCASLLSAGAVGYNHPDDLRYGIHINLHRRHLSPLAEARIMMFLVAEQNKGFVQAIAQRHTIYHPDVDIGGFGTWYQKVSHIGGSVHNKIATRNHRSKICGVGKYAPLQLKTSPDIAEFRLFQSTLNPTSFMKNIEFVYALWAWTTPRAATGNSWNHMDFITWLTAPQQRASYPALVAYLSRPVFKIKGGYSIKNTWLELMNKPSIVVFEELLAA